MAGGLTRASRARALQQNEQSAVPPAQLQQRSQPLGQSSAGRDAVLTDERDSLKTSNQYTSAQQAESPYAERSRRSTTLPFRHASETPKATPAENNNACHEADALGVHVKEVISVINHLEGLGLQQQNIQLPKCVVLGEQSSGKSSVIEAISGVRTPRAGGTCTRCPLFISLASSNDPQDTWSALASLSTRSGFSVVDRDPV